MLGGLSLILIPQTSAELSGSIESLSGLKFQDLIASLSLGIPELEEVFNSNENIFLSQLSGQMRTWNWGEVEYFSGVKPSCSSIERQSAFDYRSEFFTPKSCVDDNGSSNDKICPPALKGALGFLLVFLTVSCPKLPPLPDPVTIGCYGLLFAVAVVYYLFCDLPRNPGRTISALLSKDDTLTIDQVIGEVQGRVSSLASKLCLNGEDSVDMMQEGLNQFLSAYGKLPANEIINILNVELQRFIGSHDFSRLPGAEDLFREVSRTLDIFISG